MSYQYVTISMSTLNRVLAALFAHSEDELHDEIAKEYGPSQVANLVPVPRKLLDHWKDYKAFLQAKYPAKPGEAWKFTCEHHQAIDDLLSKLPYE